MTRGLACKTVAHEHQNIKGNTPMHRQPVQFRTDELRYMPKLRNPTNQSNSSIQNRLQLRCRCMSVTYSWGWGLQVSNLPQATTYRPYPVHPEWDAWKTPEFHLTPGGIHVRAN